MRVVLFATLVAAALAGCGGGTSDQTASPSTPAPAPSAATETPTPPIAPTPSAFASPTATVQPLPSVSPEDQPGGAGDEREAARVPAEYTITEGGNMAPPQISVPAFLAIALIVHNQTSRQVTVRFVGEKVLTIPAGETGRVRLEGRKKGSYLVDASPAGQASLVTGAQPGP